MSLYCETTGYGDGGGEWEGDGWSWYDAQPITIPVLGRRKRCCSCGEFCKPLSDGASIERFRAPISEVEHDIYGDGIVGIAYWWYCEDCYGLDLALTELGFGYMLGDDLRELVKVEYKAYRQSDSTCAEVRA